MIVRWRRREEEGGREKERSKRRRILKIGAMQQDQVQDFSR